MTLPSMAQLLQPKQQLAGYEIDEMVGKGGMGEVYRARQLSMDRVVALKILAPRLVKQDPIFAKRFVEEARAAGRLNHPNIIAVHDVGKAPMPGATAGDADLDYFSMEFVDGESVKDVIERQEFCPLSVVNQVISGMTEAMVYAEAQGIVHRDIKPDNIMITNGGVVKLADLGLALQLGDEEIIVERDEQGRGKVMGTPLYMSPEQARALPVDARSDQYSLGATLFHMLTGKPPFKGENAKMIMRSHVFDPVPDPKAINPDVPEGWRHVCMRLMAKTPEERFPTAIAMRVAVHAAISGHGLPGISRRVRTASWSAAGQAAGGMPPWAKYMVYGFAAVVVLMVVGFVIPWGGSSKEVKPLDMVLPAQADVAKAAEAAKEAKIVERVQRDLSELPADHKQAIAALDRLSEDKEIPPGPARNLIESERKLRAGLLVKEEKTLLEEKNKQRQIRSLELNQAWATNDLERVKACIDYLTPEADKLSESARLDLESITKKFPVALVNLQGKFTGELVEAAKSEQVNEIKKRVAASALSVEAKEALNARADKKLKDISPVTVAPTAPTAPTDEQVLWQAFHAKLEGLRGGLTYLEIERLADKEAQNFPSSEAQAMVKSIGQLGRLAVKAEVGLRIHIKDANPIEEIIFESKLIKAELRSIDSKVNFVVQAGANTAERKEDRKHVILPLRKLLDKALERSSESADDRNAMIAGMLWIWRQPDAAEVFATIPNSPLTKAVQELERKTRVLDVHARVVRSGNEVTVTYDGANNPWFIEDFIGQGARVGPKGMSWSTAVTVPSKGKAKENDIPTLQWKQALRAPFHLTGQLKLSPNINMLLFGVASGDRRWRVGLNNTRSPHSCLVVTTNAKTNGFEGAKSSWTGVLTSDALQNIEVQVDAEYKATIRCNGVLVSDKVQLPVGGALTPIIQAVQLEDGFVTSIEMESLVITGVAPSAE